jgi:alpha-ribazole phosphatase
MEVVLIRHARPDVAPGVCYGALDLKLAQPVTPAPARITRMLDGLPPSRLVASPATRARETAVLLKQHADTPACEIEPLLREMDFGAWEGQPWDAIPRDALDLWGSDLMGARPHGGESAHQVMARVTAWAGTLDTGSDGCLWVVTHAGPMRMLAAHWLGLTLAQTLHWQLEFGATCHFQLGKGHARLGWWNRSVGI